MLNIKIKESENPKDKTEPKSGSLADCVFYMRHMEYGNWYMESILPSDELPRFPMPAPVCMGIAVSECIKLCNRQGKAYAVDLVAHISRLNKNALTYRLPPIDEEIITAALSELIRVQPWLLTDDSCLFAHVQITAQDSHMPKTVYRSAQLTIALEYVNTEPVKPIRAVSDVCPFTVTDKCVGAMYQSAVTLMHFDANDRGFDNVLWLDHVYNKYILGLAGMNIFIRTENGVLTPSDTFEGIMSQNVITLMNDWSVDVAARKLSVDELINQKDNIIEVFAVNTRMGVLPVTAIDIDGTLIEFKSGKLAKKLSDTLINIEQGIHPSLKDIMSAL